MNRRTILNMVLDAARVGTPEGAADHRIGAAHRRHDGEAVIVCVAYYRPIRGGRTESVYYRVDRAGVRTIPALEYARTRTEGGWEEVTLDQP